MTEQIDKAAIFDLGGVVLDSPLHAIARFERDRGIPEAFVWLSTRPPAALGHADERCELDLEAFSKVFGAECREHGHLLPERDLMEHSSSGPRPTMLEALRRIRQQGLAVARSCR